jgi:hypothetical protein
MAKRPAQSLVVLSRQVENDGCRVNLRLSPARARGEAQISNDQESGEGRSARLKCRTLRRDKDESEMAAMLDCSGRVRYRQERRIRQEG